MWRSRKTPFQFYFPQHHCSSEPWTVHAPGLHRLLFNRGKSSGNKYFLLLLFLTATRETAFMYAIAAAAMNWIHSSMHIGKNSRMWMRNLLQRWCQKWVWREHCVRTKRGYASFPSTGDYDWMLWRLESLTLDSMILSFGIPTLCACCQTAARSGENIRK